MKTVTIFILPILSILLCGCSHHDKPVLPEIEYRLVIVDSVGIEMGDSNGIIGLPTQAAFTPNGNVAVLDLKKHSIAIFSTDGSFIQQIAQEGEGPGDLMRPTGFGIFPEGSILVLDGK